MDQERERIEADLRGLLRGEVRCGDPFVQMHASDASLYEIAPLGVVRPRGVQDVVACLQYAAENNLPIHARGAGTGTAGQALGPGLVLDFSHFMRRIVAMDGNTIRVQSGMVLGQLNRHLAEYGRTFGPDPATSEETTLGGLLAIDASGSHWLRYGSARDHIVSMQAVLANGEVIEACPIVPSAADADGINGRDRQLASQLAEMLTKHAKTIAANQPQSIVNHCGYQLNDIAANNHIDLAKMLVGSEGTLALITEATIRTTPLPKHRGVVLLFFDRLERAARASLQVREMGVTACDLLGRRILSIARDTDVRFDLLIPHHAEALLLVEYHGDTAHEVQDRVKHLVDYIGRRKRLAFDSQVAFDPDEVDLFWQLVTRIIPSFYQSTGTTRPLPFVEDMAVPPEQLPDFLVRVQNILKRHGVTASSYIHAGHGQLHLRPILNLADPNHRKKLRPLATDLYQEVAEVGGTIAGDRGLGLSRSGFIHQQYESLEGVFRGIKRLFDPQHLLNPGKIVTGAGPELIERSLRPLSTATANPSPSTALSSGAIATNKATKTATNQATEKSTARPTQPNVPAGWPNEIQLNWNLTQISNAAHHCDGCGDCRTQSPETRMCPIFRLLLSEESSPRAKANLMRAILTGQLPPSELTTNDFKQLADLCVHCHQCRLECPARVDIPQLMTECKGQFVATNGLRPSEAFITRLDTVAAIGSLFNPLTNWALGNRQMRWLLEKMFGISQRRKLPRVASRSFMHWAHRHRLTRHTSRADDAPHKVALFVDVYANWYDVQLAKALVAILRRNEVAVYVPPTQHQSGMAAVALGTLDRAKYLAAHNVTILAEAIRQDYHIITPEPAAALCLTHEYPQLIDDDDAHLVAENTSEACTYLWKLHRERILDLNLSPINKTVGYHMPCHLKALKVGSPGEYLMGLIPGLTIQRLEEGCSGMAGTFGLKRENFRHSIRAGRGLIASLRDPEIEYGATECSACKLQMEQGTTKPTIHPIKLLALAYGVMPELTKLLHAQSGNLTVT